MSSSTRKLICIWSGNNEMSINRQNAFRSILQYSGVDVILVTPFTLNDTLVPNHTIHKAYKYLSFTHRADYLRAYYMYHYGGGYSDIKLQQFDWNPYFALMECGNVFVGYREKRPSDIASNDSNIRNAFGSLGGMGHFIFRKHSEIAKEWLEKVELILSRKYKLLQENPGTYHPRAITGGVQGATPFEYQKFKDSKYPLSWNEIGGAILHPIMYKHKNELNLSMPFPNISHYK